jgi:predicted small secreted protein
MRIAGLAVLAAAAVLAAGCGSTAERNAYVDELNDVQQGFAEAVARAGEVTATSTRAERVLGRYRAAIAAIVTDLAAIGAPEDVEPEHRRLIATMDAFGEDVEEAGAAALAASSQAEAAEAEEALRAAQGMVSERLTTTVGAINRKLGG